MELEKFIIKRIKETTIPSWIFNVDGDTIDVYIPDDRDIDDAQRSLIIMIELFVNEFNGPAAPVKYLIWNDKREERSGITDPEHNPTLAFLSNFEQSDD